MEKVCKVCKVSLPLKDFHKNGNGHRPRCKSCRKPETKARYDSADKDLLKKYSREYRRNNLEERRSKWNDWHNNRISNDPLYKLKHNTASLIKHALGKCKGGEKTESILGCTVEEFKSHIESQFCSWMSWENKGLYNGQHIFNLYVLTPTGILKRINCTQ